MDRYTTALDQHILNTVGLDGQIRPALGQMILARLEKADVVAWFKAEAERWQATSCNGWLRVLVSLLNDAVGDKLIARNVAALVKPIPEDEHPDDGDNTFEPEELGAIIEEWRRRCALVWPDAPEYLHPRFHGRHRRDLKVQGFLIVLAAAVTGMRWGEVTALQPADLDKAEREGALLVRRAHYRGQLKGTKGRRRRSVPWPHALSELFREYRRWMVAVEHPGIAAGYLFTTEKGTLLVNGSLSKEWRDVLKAVGIERRVTFHGLRHTMVDLLRQAGVDSFIRQSIVGHESDAMQRRYSKVRPDEARAAGEQALRLIPGGVHSGVHRGEDAEARRHDMAQEAK
ncbi:MAG: tyrosine-type recombinase/integrase [Deltaproteobacteria bacterium]|nr:tyrosine-type recombinase/integrase [Deltaproteobacteria bacterium]